MNKRKASFERTIGLDQSIIDRLLNYLKDQESRLSKQLLSLIPTTPLNPQTPLLPQLENDFSLGESVDFFVRQVEKLPPEFRVEEEQKEKINELNHSLWDYTISLEGCIVELFQQIKQTPIDCWHLSIRDIVTKVKEIIFLRIQEVVGSLQFLQKALAAYFKKNDKGFLRNIFQKNFIDPTIIHHLEESKKSLSQHYEKFLNTYQGFDRLDRQVDEEIGDIEHYSVLSLLEITEQNTYTDLFRLVKAFKLNHDGNKEISQAITEAIKKLGSLEAIYKIFSNYYEELKEALFSTSLEWKFLNHEGHAWGHAVEVVKSKIEEYLLELQGLIYLIGHYRLFLLETDPNPYVRSRWGFTEWVVAPEPIQVKKFLELIYSCEELQASFNQFIFSLKEKKSTLEEEKIREEVNESLYSMSQPLISKKLMQKRASRFLDGLESYNEIATPHLSSIATVQEWLSQAMREDWKYNVLHEYPLYHKLYKFHRGLSCFYEDPSHKFRLEKFSYFFKQIEEWVTKRSLHAHVQEIESDICDIKSYLQDYLGSVQRALKDQSKDPFFEETRQKLQTQLLEYRYVFGNFFSSIGRKNDYGEQVKNEFIFVDYYFESVEILLNY